MSKVTRKFLSNVIDGLSTGCSKKAWKIDNFLTQLFINSYSWHLSTESTTPGDSKMNVFRWVYMNIFLMKETKDSEFLCILVKDNGENSNSIKEAFDITGKLLQ